jgi:sirohydrochlorin cobaltochelatase
MDAVAARIGALAPQTPVICAFLELTSPDLATAVQTLVAQGLRRVTVVPMFLGVGRHAREDLPVLMTQLQAEHPAVEFRLQRAVGEDGRLTDLLARMALD